MDKIIISSQNPNDVSKEELAELASEIEKHIRYKVEYHKKESVGYGVTWYEVVLIWLGIEVSKTVYKEVVEPIVKDFIVWAKNRMRRNLSRRPNSLTIYDSKGKKIKSISVLNQDGEVKDNTEDNKEIVEKYNLGKPPTESEPF